MQCYILKGGREAISLDTGMRLHLPEIRAGFAKLLRGVDVKKMLLTRREMDVTLNLDQLVQEFGFQSVLSGGELDPLDFFASMDDANAESLIAATSTAEFTFIRSGEVVDTAGTRIRIIRAPMRVLSSMWYFDEGTRTLFSGDAFAYITSDRASGPGISRSACLDRDHILACLSAKYDWMLGIDTTQVIEEVKDALDGLEIDRICPTHGHMIEGRDAVKQSIAATMEGLQRMSVSRRPAPMEDFAFSPGI
jgi:glyoxylase-like metal-dependent hydrolase (beta-lactamase superfamily II)